MLNLGLNIDLNILFIYSYFFEISLHVKVHPLRWPRAAVKACVGGGWAVEVESKLDDCMIDCDCLIQLFND